MKRRIRLIQYNEFITHQDIHSVFGLLSSKEREEMESKLFYIMNNSSFGSEEFRALSERMFRMGYAAAHIEKEGDWE